MIGKPLAEAQAIMAQYDRKLPFVARLSAICQEMAVRVGYTELYDGARRHWNLYEAAGIYAKGAGPCASKRRGAAWRTPSIRGTASSCVAPAPTPRSMR